jgi:hypothetical protein
VNRKTDWRVVEANKKKTEEQKNRRKQKNRRTEENRRQIGELLKQTRRKGLQ